MGKPRMIIVIRHAQSEGNQNRQIHQTIPDHRVKLTPEGWTQAHDAGRRLRAMLRPDDTLQVYTSPYRRTRETTEGILRSLTSDDPEPSPFKRQAIKVWEEPRIREQDFGNFQPNSDAMERMWRERADYGHFFYRIPNGESASDAYDRISGFNESLWRSFGEDDFPSVCVLVTHGLMTRVFLMKWYHWSVEYFEDLRNINHCEFVIMERNTSGKFDLQNKLRTWTELKRQKAAEKQEDIVEARKRAPSIPVRKRWGNCPDDCDHVHDEYSQSSKRRNTGVFEPVLPAVRSPPVTESVQPDPKPQEPQHEPPKPHEHHHLHPLATMQKPNDPITSPPSAGPLNKVPSLPKGLWKEEDDEAFPRPPAVRTVTAELWKGVHAGAGGGYDPTEHDSTNLANLPHNAASFSMRLAAASRPRERPNYLEAGRDFGGSFSGAATPVLPGSPTDDHAHDYFAPKLGQFAFNGTVESEVLHDRGGGGENAESPGPPKGHGRLTEEERARMRAESGMGSGAMADALGDHTPEVEKVMAEEEVEEAQNDDEGGAEQVGLAKAGESVSGKEGRGREEAGRKLLGAALS